VPPFFIFYTRFQDTFAHQQQKKKTLEASLQHRIIIIIITTTTTTTRMSSNHRPHAIEFKDLQDLQDPSWLCRLHPKITKASFEDFGDGSLPLEEQDSALYARVIRLMPHLKKLSYWDTFVTKTSDSLHEEDQEKETLPHGISKNLPPGFVKMLDEQNPPIKMLFLWLGKRTCGTLLPLTFLRRTQHLRSIRMGDTMDFRLVTIKSGVTHQRLEAMTLRTRTLFQTLAEPGVVPALKHLHIYGAGRLEPLEALITILKRPFLREMVLITNTLISSELAAHSESVGLWLARLNKTVLASNSLRNIEVSDSLGSIGLRFFNSEASGSIYDVLRKDLEINLLTNTHSQLTYIHLPWFQANKFSGNPLFQAFLDRNEAMHKRFSGPPFVFQETLPALMSLYIQHDFFFDLLFMVAECLEFPDRPRPLDVSKEASSSSSYSSSSKNPNAFLYCFHINLLF